MTEPQEILLSPQNRSSRNAHPWKTQALQPAEISSFCKWLPRMLIRYEGHLWARNWTSPASRIQRKELQPAGDASVQPCRLQKNAHLEPTTGVCFYYQSHNSRTTEYKSMDYFLFQTDASSGLSPQKRLFQVPAALGFYLKDLYLIYCWRQAGERLPYLPQPTGKGLMTKSHCSCLQLPLSLTPCGYAPTPITLLPTFTQIQTTQLTYPPYRSPNTIALDFSSSATSQHSDITVVQFSVGRFFH